MGLCRDCDATKPLLLFNDRLVVDAARVHLRQKDEAKASSEGEDEGEKKDSEEEKDSDEGEEEEQSEEAKRAKELEDDPAYSPDSEMLRDIKGG